jgi:hypothetical protein
MACLPPAMQIGLPSARAAAIAACKLASESTITMRSTTVALSCEWISLTETLAAAGRGSAGIAKVVPVRAA